MALPTTPRTAGCGREGQAGHHGPRATAAKVRRCRSGWSGSAFSLTAPTPAGNVASDHHGNNDMTLARLRAVIAGMLLLSCAGVVAESDYRRGIDDWHQNRIASIKAAEGWLSFVGSGTVGIGGHRVGAGHDNDIVLAVGPDHLGVLTLAPAGEIRLRVDQTSAATVDGQPAAGEITLLTQRDEDGPTRVYLGQAWFYVVRLGDGSTGWRLRDPDARPRQRFTGIERFPVDEGWRVRARWQPLAEPEAVEIVTSSGTLDTLELVGSARFERDGREYVLRPVREDDGRLFFIFADRTSGRQTYGAARFLYADPPTAGEDLVLDFNKAINPPCALTPHVVCPLPPPGNRLDLAVTAGEHKPAADLHDP